MIHRKENGQLKAKAGLGIVDNILSTLSNHPIANRACALKFGEVEAELTTIKTYSTTETAIGIWHDGRTIYRRCVIFDTNHSWAHRVWGTILADCGFTTLIDLKPIGGNSRTVFSNFFTRIENGDLQMYLESDSDWSIREFVIEYAK